MAEQTPVVQNKRLLIVALVLAALVVLLFNVYVSGVGRGDEDATVELAAFARPMRRGDKIKDGDLKAIRFPQQYTYGLPNVLEWDRRAIAKDKFVTQTVQENEFVRFAHITPEEGSASSNLPREPNVSWSFEIDRQGSPGDILWPNSWINLVGLFTINGKTKAYLVIEKVRVLTVGGRGAGELGGDGAGRSSAGMGQRSYGSITIEVPPKVALELDNVKSHAIGQLWVQVLHAGAVPNDNPKVNAELARLAGEAGVSRRAPGE